MLQLNDKYWKQQTTSLFSSISGLNPIKGANNSRSREKASQEVEWNLIYEHSLAKKSKSMAEQCYAPNPLPPDLSERFDDQIESSRNQLITMLMQSKNTLYDQKSFTI